MKERTLHETIRKRPSAQQREKASSFSRRSVSRCETSDRIFISEITAKVNHPMARRHRAEQFNLMKEMQARA